VCGAIGKVLYAVEELAPDLHVGEVSSDRWRSANTRRESVVPTGQGCQSGPRCGLFRYWNAHIDIL
jgi:hypothetical protein